MGHLMQVIENVGGKTINVLLKHAQTHQINKMRVIANLIFQLVP